MDKKFIALLGLTLLVGLFGWFYLPGLLELPDLLVAHIICGVILPMLVPATATIWYILTSLKAFKTKTKIAYYFIAVGILFYGLIQIGQLGLNIISIFFPNFVLGPVANNATFVGPYIVSVVCMYVGVQILAKLLGVRSIWLSPFFAGGVAIILAAASVLLPNTPVPDPAEERGYVIMFAIITATAAFGLVATGIATAIKNTINTSYKQAMGWLAVALGVMTLVTLHEVVLKATDLITTWYSANGIDLIGFLLVGLLFMKAGQALKKATFQKLPGNAPYVDAVVYTAGLVSNMKAIDTTLDDLRIVTASIKSGDTLTADQKKTLIKVYRSVEEYLVTKEPLLNLTKASLRARLTAEFQEELAKSEPAPAAPAPAV